MLKYCGKGEILLLGSNFSSYPHFCYLMSDFYIKTRIWFSLRDKRLFEITEVEITRVDCIFKNKNFPVQRQCVVLVELWLCLVIKLQLKLHLSRVTCCNYLSLWINWYKMVCLYLLSATSRKHANGFPLSLAVSQGGTLHQNDVA